MVMYIYHFSCNATSIVMVRSILRTFTILPVMQHLMLWLGTFTILPVMQHLTLWLGTFTMLPAMQYLMLCFTIFPDR